MISYADGIISADVSIAADLSAVVVIPKEIKDRRRLGKALGAIVPRASISLTTVGYSIEAFAAAYLIDSENEDLYLNWSDEAKRFVENRKKALSIHSSMRQTVAKILSSGSEELENSIIKKYHGVLDNHQLVNVAAMTLENSYGLCVFDEQGAGKTVSMIYTFDSLIDQDIADIALIVAPKSMVSEWPKDFQKFMGDLYKVIEVIGNKSDKKFLLSQGADVYVTNFETAITLESEFRSILRRHKGRAIIIIDESFFIKNLNAKRTKALRRLREWCDRAYVLCGTPAPNSPSDLVQQFNIVDFGMTFREVDIPKDRDQARQTVQAAIEKDGVFVRHLKSDVLPSLPTKTFHRVLVQMEPEQKALYGETLKKYSADLKSTSEEQFRHNFTSFLARRTALLQICSNPKAIVSDYSETPAKLKALDMILEEAISKKSEKVIIWSFYTISLNEIFQRYSRYHPVRYDGTVSDTRLRRAAVKNFQEDNKTMLFVANPAAAGAGLTLHRARIAIYDSMSNQAAHYLQSLDRIHRRGQSRDVQYLILLCDSSLELLEYDRLLRKEKSAQDLLGDNVPEPITRDMLLNEVAKAESLIGDMR